MVLIHNNKFIRFNEPRPGQKYFFNQFSQTNDKCVDYECHENTPSLDPYMIIKFKSGD